MTPKEEILKYLERITHPYPSDPHALSKEVDERTALLARATQLKADAKYFLTIAIGSQMNIVEKKMTATEIKGRIGAATAELERVYDLADGLHSDLVHAIGVGRTLISNEKAYMQSMGNVPVNTKTGEIIEGGSDV